MTNHFRTLLLNLSGNIKPPGTYPGEEYVPPGFVAQWMPPNLQQVWNVLFGYSPDRAMVNYRLRQYMPLVHAAELEQYVLALDQRVTYWPLYDDSLFQLSTFGAE